MVADPDLVRYACIAHNQFDSPTPNSTILAEFNSSDSSLQELAQQCIQHTPPHHSNYSQTYKKQTYTFILDYPFVYFAIFESNMDKSDQIRFLGRLKEALNRIIKSNSDKNFASLCFQGEFHPVFHKLLSKSLDFDALNIVPNGVHPNHMNDNANGKVNVSVSSSSKSRKIMGLPMITSSKLGKGLKKKRVSGDSVMDSKEALMVDNDEDVDVGEVKSRGVVCHDGMCMLDGGVRRQKAKKIWRRHVWIVLVLDLAVCLILFGIWLFVCRGFECIDA